MREAVRCLAIQVHVPFISGGIRSVVKERSGARVASATNVVLWERSRRVRTREPAAVQVDNDNDTEVSGRALAAAEPNRSKLRLRAVTLRHCCYARQYRRDMIYAYRARILLTTQRGLTNSSAHPSHPGLSFQMCR